MRGENRSTRRKTSRSKGDNQQQTQPTYGVDAYNDVITITIPRSSGASRSNLRSGVIIVFLFFASLAREVKK